MFALAIVVHDRDATLRTRPWFRPGTDLSAAEDDQRSSSQAIRGNHGQEWHEIEDIRRSAASAITTAAASSGNIRQGRQRSERRHRAEEDAQEEEIRHVGHVGSVSSLFTRTIFRFFDSNALDKFLNEQDMQEMSG